ncbi:efflux RND transporter periplasmic adaptor subunit [Entomobacter blattae]|uniref:Multidrug resistance protein MdtA n=1 Tax=Entomobacter blattae TaxID=2762277 RepID=A0A7H1NND5_9PROT|nr:efflux RND transporter periplasmic adaptor subunit [Entomobacter blattae]QNT77295.1 Multidrug resistance protein MdtA [Entomobacter blattae]
MLSSPRHKKTFFWLVLAFLVCLLLAFLFFRQSFTTSSQKHSYSQEAQPVGTASALIGDMPVILSELGTVVPITNVTVQTRVSGHLLKVYFHEGDYVKKGDLLALIDPRPFEASKAQYEGTLESDTAQLEQAKLDSARYQKLMHQNSIASQTAQDQQYKVAQLKGQIKVDQALIQQQKLNIMYSHVTAPVEGRVGIRQVDAGNYVTAGQSGGLVILTQMQPISVILTVPEKHIQPIVEQLRLSKKLTVEAWDSSNTKKLAKGTTEVLDSQIDTSTGTVRMRAIFDNTDTRLFPNEFVNAHILLKTLSKVILLPTRSLQTGPDGQFVYVVKPDHTIEVRPVNTGESYNGNTVITSGIKANEMVVTDGTDHLKTGIKVSVANPAPLKEPSASKQPLPTH